MLQRAQFCKRHIRSTHLDSVITITMCAVATFMPIAVEAQQTSIKAGTSAAADGTEDQAEIVVTASKREERLSRVPMSISAVSQDALDKRGLKDAQDLARIVPGLTFNQTGFTGQPVVAIRGLVSNVGASTTGIYIDDTPIQNRSVIAGLGSAFPRLFDLDRAEVLRGPQGTLFGAGSQGGTIRFITPQPNLNHTDGYAVADTSLTEGGSPSYEGGVALGAPLVEGKLAVRASIWGQHQGGYIDRLAFQKNDIVERNINYSNAFVSRVALTYAPTDTLTITPSVFFQRYYKADPDQFFPDAGHLKSQYKIDQPLTDRFALYSLGIEKSLGSVQFKSITSYFRRDQDRTNDYSYFEASAYQGGPYLVIGNPSFNYIATQRLKSMQSNWNEELRFSSDYGADSRWSWIGGLFLSSQKQSSYQTVVEPIGVLTQAIAGLTVEEFFGVPDGPIQFIEDMSFLTHEVAGFGEVSYELAPKLKVTGGLRIAWNSLSFQDAQSGPEAGGSFRYSGRSSETPVTPKISVNYQARPDWLVYATAAKGYRIGGANSAMATNASCRPSLQTLGQADAPSTYKSDEVWSYEIGNKASFFNRRLSLSASAFWIDWSRIQGSVFVASCGLNYLTNFGKATSRGFDLQAEARPLPGFTLSGTLGYTDAYYSENASIPGGNRLVARKGDSLLNTPKWTGTAAAEYSFDALPSAKAFVRGDYQYVGSYFGSVADGVNGHDPALRNQVATEFVSARTGLRFPMVELNLYVDNLLNTARPRQRFADLPGQGLYRAVTFRPRTIGLSAKYRF